MISLHSLVLAVCQLASCVKLEWRECSAYSPPATVILLLFLIFEALLFAIFTAIMLGSQLQAIWNDETVIYPINYIRFELCYIIFVSLQGIEQLKKEQARWVRKSRWKSIQSVFGRFSMGWFSPFTQTKPNNRIQNFLHNV